MNCVVEETYRSMSRYGEELCGDHVEMMKKDDGTIFVLSDGLGSGVKANILATLTSKIAIGLIEKNLPLEEIIETLVATLPICEVRQMAYSTLAILKVYNNGKAHLIEMDTPSAFLLRNGKVQPLEMEERMVKGKLIKESRFQMNQGDYIFLTSDGILHAGIGGLMDFGLGWDGVSKHLEEMAETRISLKEMVEKMMKICQAYYLMEPGDDFTILGAGLRRPKLLTIMTGPPMDEQDDQKIVKRLLWGRGKKVISGGTTAQIFSRVTDRELHTTLDYFDPDVPPISKIQGVDLVTEGLLTLNKAVQYLKEYVYPDIPTAKDGASLLAKELLESDEITLLVGRAVNEAHQSLNLPFNLGVRTQVIKRLVTSLEEHLHKTVHVEWF